MLTKRGGLLTVLGVALILFSLSFYAIRDFAYFVGEITKIDLREFLPNIMNLIYLSPAFILIGALILSSVIFSFTSFQQIMRPDYIEIKRKISSDRCFAGDLVTVTLEIRNKSPFWLNNVFISDILPDVFDLSFGENFIIINLPPKKKIELSYVIRCSTRGVYKIGPIQLVLQDKAGLFMKNFLIEKYTEIRVYPSYEDIRRFETLMRAYGSILFGRYRVRERGHGYDFWGLRKYQPTDSIRFIDWKASARRGELYIKEYEAERNVKMYIFLDASSSMGLGHKRMTKIDYAARVCVLLSYLANRAQDFFGLVVFSDNIRDFIPARRGKKHFYKILEALARAEAHGASNLTQAMREFIKRERRAALAFIISDLEGDFSSIEEGIKIALSNKVWPIIIAPIGPLFEILPNGELTKAFFEVALTEYMRRRDQLKLRLAKYGVKVLDVGPEEILGISLEAFLKAKGRGIRMM